jgi:carboxymethylenebutenolidase
VYENETRIRTDVGEMTTFIARPDDDGPFPVGILYMDDVGYREQIKQNARRFAADAYSVVAPDLFYRAGEKLTFDVSRLGEPGYRERLVEVVSTVTHSPHHDLASVKGELYFAFAETTNRQHPRS